MNWAGIILIVLHFISMGISLGLHGRPRTEKYNFFTTTIGTGIVLTLYYFGGLF